MSSEHDFDKEYEDFRMFRIAISKNNNSGGGRSGSGCFTIMAVIVIIFAVFFTIAGELSACNARKTSETSSYKVTSGYSSKTEKSSSNSYTAGGTTEWSTSKSIKEKSSSSASVAAADNATTSKSSKDSKSKGSHGSIASGSGKFLQSSTTDAKGAGDTQYLPVEGAYMSEELKANSSWQGRDYDRHDVTTTKYYYDTSDNSYVFWVNDHGKILEVVATRDDVKKGTSENASKNNKNEKVTKESPEYDVDDFVHPDDFYEWYKDDFADFEEAEDYWEEHQGE